MFSASGRATATPPLSKQSGSALVRRLTSAGDDPARRRLREWLGAVHDKLLLDFGLNAEEIGRLRGLGEKPDLATTRAHHSSD
jgi:hypothetical protein